MIPKAMAGSMFRSSWRLWGVVDPLPGEDLMGYETRLHPRARDIIFYYPMREELGPETVLTICRSLRRLQHRLSA